MWIVPAFFPSLYKKIHNTFDGYHSYPPWSFAVLFWPLLIIIPPIYYVVRFAASLDEKILNWRAERSLNKKENEPKQLIEHVELSYRDANCNGCGRPLKK